MLRYSLNGLKLKVFVKGTEASGDSDGKSFQKKLFPVATLTGDKAKEFYEDVIRESSSSSSSSSLPPSSGVKGREVLLRPKRKVTCEKNYKNCDLLTLAQNNDVKGLENFFATRSDFDVNVADDFGWTPLMCASCSGAEEAVGMLLQKGADVQRCDRAGNSAEKLARQKNHKRIVEMLERRKGSGSESEREGEGEEEGEGEGEGREERGEEDNREPFVCETCKGTFTSKGNHESSTVHLFHCKRKSCTFYGIAESNRGFQLLLRGGWDRERGLGKGGEGRKYPVRAVVKKDRRGIGGGEGGRKREGDEGVKYGSSRKEELYKKWKDKNFERNFRLEFS